MVFIFIWSPVLITSGGSQPLNMGLAFASLMLAFVAGIYVCLFKCCYKSIRSRDCNLVKNGGQFLNSIHHLR